MTGWTYRTPGTLLISRDQLLAGGVSECRNKALQTMFLMIGAAEKAGSGIDKIRQGWRSQHWRDPRIEERDRPSRVHLELPMVSLMPDEVLHDLNQRFGAGRVERLAEPEVQALVTAYLESQVTNARMREITDQHPADLTRILQGLAKGGYLVQEGRKRGASYRLSDALGREKEGSPHKPVDSPHKPADSPHKPADSPHKHGDSPHKGSGRHLRALEDLDQETLQHLRRVAAPARQAGRLAPERTRRIILALCQGRYLAAAVIGALMNRSTSGIQDRFLKPMAREGLLHLLHPDKPNQPNQAYTSSGEGNSMRRQMNTPRVTKGGSGFGPLPVPVAGPRTPATGLGCVVQRTAATLSPTSQTRFQASLGARKRLVRATPTRTTKPP